MILKFKFGNSKNVLILYGNDLTTKLWNIRSRRTDDYWVHGASTTQQGFNEVSETAFLEAA